MAALHNKVPVGVPLPTQSALAQANYPMNLLPGLIQVAAAKIGSMSRDLSLDSPDS